MIAPIVAPSTGSVLRRDINHRKPPKSSAFELKNSDAPNTNNKQLTTNAIDN